MNFFMMPSGSAAYQQSDNISSYPFRYESYPYYHVNTSRPNNVNQPMNVYPRVERNIPFKVYLFEGEFDKLSNASNVLRFEIDVNNGRSCFELFDRVLRENSIDLRSYSLHYIDDEHDLVDLSNERDFQFMIKLMKGQLTKVICEKKTQHPRIIQAQIPQPSFVQCFPVRPSNNKESNLESMLDKAFTSSFEKLSKPQQMKDVKKDETKNCPTLFDGFLKIIRQNMNKEPKKEEESVVKSEVETKEQKPITPKDEEPSVTTPTEQQVETPKEEPANTVETELTPSISTEHPILKEEPTNETSQQSINIENQDPIIESVVEDDDEDQYIKTSIPHKYQKELRLLHSMGFSNHIANINLLNKNNGDIERTISELIHQ